MAIGTPAHVASGTDTTGSLTVTATLGAGESAPADGTVITVQANRHGTDETITWAVSDSVNGAYTDDVETATDNGAGAFLFAIGTARFHDNAALGNGDTISAVLTGDNPNTSAIIAAAVSGLDLTTGASATNSAGNTNASPTVSVTPPAGPHLMIFALAVRTNGDDITPDANFTEINQVLADNGTSAQSTRLQMVFDIVDLDGATPVSFAPSLANGSRTWAAWGAAFAEADVAGPPKGSLALLGVGV